MAIGDGSQRHPQRGGSAAATSVDDAAGGGSGQSPPPPVTLRLWAEVGTGIDKSQTVVWQNAVDSLNQAFHYLLTSDEARRFVETYMLPMIKILLEQQPSKIGQMEKHSVEESLRIAVAIICEDLNLKAKAAAGPCKVLDVLSMIFNRKKPYYKGAKPSWNVNLTGLPEVRVQKITRFRTSGGFNALGTYLAARVSTSDFPPLDILHLLLAATGEAIPNEANANPSKLRSMEDEAIRIAQAVMDFMDNLSEEELKKQPHEILSQVRYDLQRIFDRLLSSRRKETYAFYEFWRGLILKLITSQSLPLKLFGWDQVSELTEASGDMRPPPRAFIVRGAGCKFVNGRYDFAGPMTDDGYSKAGTEIRYELDIPDAVPEVDGGGKKLTLFRCTMRSQQKWWFISEADEDQPGTDKDIDYYQHKSKQHEENEPPSYGWVTCKNSGIDPAPTLVPSGLMVPNGEEYNTLEHQLAQWAVKNKIVDLVLGDSVHREIVARSTYLIKFLASMCTRDDPMDIDEVGVSERVGRNAYCLRTSDLLLAWKTCTSRADAAVSAEIYQLLVSILPDLPKTLAIPLLEAVQSSLTETSDGRSYLAEVAEFCGALATASQGELDNGGGVRYMSDEAREQVLKLLWAVVTHADAGSLKSYEGLKGYLTHELRVEPLGTTQREHFLELCKVELHGFAKGSNVAVDEVLVLRMVKLTKFILEACPTEQAIGFVTEGGLAELFFEEVTAYLRRQQSGSKMTKGRAEDDMKALTDRLLFLRYSYGLSDRIDMTTEQLNQLWSLCREASDREALMVFLANASHSDVVAVAADDTSLLSDHQGPSPFDKQHLAAAFSEEARVYTFQRLICSTDLDWEPLGEGAYQSFQSIFKSLRRSAIGSSTSRSPALDTLWRICLSVSNDNVASQAMNDTLALYSSMANVRSDATEKSGDAARTQGGENFPRRIFDCLDIVIRDLRAKKKGAELSAARCLRILNAAVNHGTSTGKESQIQVMAGSRLDLPPDASLSDVMHALPHGMRGQSCYLNVAILVRRPSQSNATAVASSVLREDGPNVSGTAPANGSQNGAVRQPTSVRFNLQLHPLETLASIKRKVASYCSHQPDLVKFLSVSGRQSLFPGRGESYSVAPNDSTVARLGIADGSELVFLLMAHLQPQSAPIAAGRVPSNQAAVARLAEAFSRDGEFGSSDRFFEMLLVILESLSEGVALKASSEEMDIQKLVWDLLLSMPTNNRVVDRVRATCKLDNPGVERMAVDSQSVEREWMLLLDARTFHRSVYTLQLIDSFMQPAPETLSVLPDAKSAALEKEMDVDATSFRTGFVDSGGFTAVLHFLTETRKLSQGKRQKTRMAYAVCLRIIRCCFFGKESNGRTDAESPSSRVALDDIGQSLLAGLKDRRSLLESLTSVVVDDNDVSDSAILDALHLLRLLLTSDEATSEVFASLSNSKAEHFLNSLLLWERGGTVSVASVGASQRIRRLTEELILAIPSISRSALPWLTAALDKIDVASDGTSEFFSVVQTLVEQRGKTRTDDGSRVRSNSALLKDLGTAVCLRLATHPRPTSDNAMIDFSTGVLCGCLKLLRALVENGGGSVVAAGVTSLIKAIGGARWSQLQTSKNKGMFDIISSPFRSMGGGVNADDLVLIDLMGAVFDGFLATAGSPSAVPICCEKESRQLGFEVVAAAARCCKGGGGYLAIVARVNEIISVTAPSMRHRWGHNFSVDDRASNRMMTNSSKYSGLRNQGCTCYMNSVLQQLFMMPDLKGSICAATVPSSLRSSLGGSLSKGVELVGKRLSLQWESGDSFDAMVEAYDEDTGMHTIRYLPHQVAAVSGSAAGSNAAPAAAPQQPLLPQELPEEFLLTDGRPGRETGVFEVVNWSEEGSNRESPSGTGESTQEGGKKAKGHSPAVSETVDEASSRRLLEEVQRTFVNLDESSRGRCFDPRALVEASGCLKLEFDVWQQNDASEFAVKLLDRLELSLKRWSNPQFRFLEHTFRLKQTKQKICKECGLKTNREENLLNIDCQIRGKSDIHEALSTMCEVEYMEGDNKVNCERCRKKTDTVLRTAISALPDVLILSLKRFDLDYNTFETVKLNSRCAFGETLNMKKYTLAGVDEMEKGKSDGGTEDDSNMDTEDEDPGDKAADSNSALSDDDYEYRLVGVLVHAGVAQGGHYYSFIKDRASEKWYRFDDEDVSAFDPSSIEVECFGGKVKKETKWPTGQVHTVESEQFANALMVFYEKVKPSPFDPEKGDDKDVPMEEDDAKANVALETTTGFDVFQADVRRANANHKWQTFLSEVEFMSFLKELLGRTHSVDGDADEDAMEVSSPASSPSSSEDVTPTWTTAILRLSLSYFYDVLLHSSDKDAIMDWGKQLENTMRLNPDAAKDFVTDLARRTISVSNNWLRVYCSECPEEVSRLAAIKVFAAAMGQCVGNPEEQASMIEWTQAWRRQVEELEEKRAEDRQSVRFVPSRLEGELAIYEDPSKLPGGRTSSLGVLLSTLALLLDHAPRTWRTSAHIPVLLGELGILNKDAGGSLLRNAMVAAQFPARLVCLGTREKSPQLLRSLFPYASMSVEDAESTVRPESTPTNHLMALPGAAVGMPGASVGPSNGSPLHASTEDCANVVEALGAIIGVEGIKRTPLIEEVDDFTRTRAPKLTKVAEEALKIIFSENMSPTGGGMSYQNIQQYLRLCGIDSSSVPPGKINGILTQYPTKVGSEGGKDCRFLTLEGFLMYYAEQAQNEERQVYGDLRRFGFRPNLTRRPEEARLIVSENQEERPRAYTITESVAIDAALSSKKQETIWLGRYAETGFLSHHFHFMAFGASVEAAEYLLAAFACGRETGRLMLDAQRAFNRAAGWGGKDIAQSCLMVFKVLAAVPDERQPDRIAALMQGTEKNSDAPLGLINAAKEVSRTPQHYSSDFYNNPGLFERYIEAVKELRRQVKVYFWLSERRSKWTWMEHWLRDVGVQQGRGDYMGHMEGVAVHPPSGPFGHPQHSDSDMNPEMNESDEEDEDSRFDQIDNHHAISRVYVKGAGNNPVNGVYVRNGSCDGVPKYTKAGVLKETKETFSLFRCRLSNDTRRWYISIVPKNIAPGTNMDRDFYSAPPGNNPNYPPASRWCTAKDEGRDPPPSINWRLDDPGEYDDVMDRGRGVGTDGTDVIDEGGNNYL